MLTSVGILKLFWFTRVLAAPKEESIIAVVWLRYSSQQHYNENGVRDFSPALGQTQQTKALNKEQVNQEWPPKSSFAPEESLSQGPLQFVFLLLLPSGAFVLAGAAPLLAAVSHLTTEASSSGANSTLGFGGAQNKRTTCSMQNLFRL